MNNNLPAHITPYSSRVKKETEIWIYAVRGILSLFIFIAWLAYYRSKNKENAKAIELLKEDNNIKSSTIQSLQGQIKDIKEQQNKPELVAEQMTRLIKNGNNVRVEKTKTLDGDYRYLNEFMSSGGW